MKKIFNLLCFLLVLIAGNCSALMISQPWNTNTWNKIIGSGADVTEITPLPNGVHRLYTDMYRNRNDKGVAMIYAYLGTAAITAGRTAGNVPEFWMECDFAYLGGGGAYCTMFGVFNSSADNDGSPAINMAGIQIASTNVAMTVDKNTGHWGSSVILTGSGVNAMHRIKLHVYNDSGRTLMDFSLYKIDGVTFKETYIGSDIGYVILNVGESFNQGMNVFGVRNTIYGEGSPPAHSQLEFDNMYFSTEGPRPVTIFNTWDTWNNNDWTITIDANTPDSEIDPMPQGEHCLYTDVYRNSLNNGLAAIYTPLGTASIPAGAGAGNVPEFWLDYDFVYLGGNTAFATMLGVFNSNGDNDNDPAINVIGVQMGGSNIQAIAGDFFASPASGTIYGDGSNITHRVKSHIYNSSGRTLMDVDIYSIDSNTLEEIYLGSIIGYVVLDIGQSLNQGMDVLGVRNTAYPSSRHNIVKFDNIYFSTEGPNENEMTAEPVGLAGWWNFDNPSNLAMDYSENSNDGQLVGNCSGTNAGFLGDGLQFNGGIFRSYSCLNNGFSSKFIGGRATLAVWLKLDSASPAWPNNGFANAGAWCYPSVYPYSANTLSLKLFLSDGSPVIVSLPSGTALTQWHHLAVSVDSHNTASGYKVYFDGILAGEFPMNGTYGNFLPADKPLIGASYNVVENAWSYMYGTIDDLRIYNKSLTVEEIKDIIYYSDFDRSGKVDYSDLSELAYVWLGNCSAPDWCGGIDINKDSTVDLADLTYFARQWMEQVP